MAIALSGNAGGLASCLGELEQAGSINSAPETSIKAAVVGNFPKFVEWPPTAFASRTAPFVVAIIGDDALAGAIDAVFAGRRLADRPITVVRVSRLEDLSTCHLLYVAASEERRLDAVLKALQGRAILSVGDLSRFAQRGGMIGLVVDDDRVRFEINERAARASGLRLSANLLRLATSVVGG
jgi:hypothetical protein